MQLESMVLRGRHLCCMGEHAVGTYVLLKAHALSHRLRHPESEIAVLLALAECADDYQETTAADALRERAVAATSTGPYSAATQIRIGLAHASLGMHDEAIRWLSPFKDGVPANSAESTDHFETQLALGHALAVQGRIDAGKKLLMRMLVRSKSCGNEPRAIAAVLSLAKLALLEGRHMQALALGEEALHQLETFSCPGGQLRRLQRIAMRTMADALERAHRPADALGALRTVHLLEERTRLEVESFGARARLLALVESLSSAQPSSASVGMRSTGSALTELELSLLRDVAYGATVRELAVARGRSLSTVRNQLSSAYRKLGVSTRAAAVSVASGRGLIDSTPDKMQTPRAEPF